MEILKNPKPEEIRKARFDAGLTQKQAAELVGLKSCKSWQFYEADPKTNKRHDKIPLPTWELFLLKIAPKKWIAVEDSRAKIKGKKS